MPHLTSIPDDGADLDLTRFNKIATWIIISRWQVDKEAVWLIESPTCLSKYIPPVLGICRFYF